jgi:hypothetical protein
MEEAYGELSKKKKISQPLHNLTSYAPHYGTHR